MTALHQKTKRAVLWSALDVFMRQGVQLVVMIALARILAPEDFGVIAMIALFVGLSSIFVDSGFSSALIQRREHTYEDESTVFWFNISSATVAASLLVLAAPWIADFFAKPVLQPLTWVMAANLWLGSLIVVHTALLTKKLDFKTQMKASLVSSLISGAVAIGFALYGWGVWALAIQVITATVVRICLLWWMHPWRPAWVFCMDSFRSLFKFGGFMLLSGLLDTMATRLYTVLIGKFYSVTDLGYYDRATALRDMPQTAISGIFSKVAFPSFSAHSNDLPKLCEGVRSSLIVVMAINLPIMFGLLAVADNLVPLFLGNHWVPTAPILKVLCVVGMLYPLHVANLELLKALGRSDLFFRLELIKKGLLVFVIIACSQLSVLAIAWGFVFNSIVAFFINAHYTKKILGYSPFQQLRDVLPYIAISFFMALVVWNIGASTNEWFLILRVGTQVVAGTAVYCGAIYLLNLEGYVLVRNMFVKAGVNARSN